MSRSGLDVASQVFNGGVVPEAGFVLFDALVDGSIGLASVEGRAVVTGNFIDGIRGKVGRRGSLGFGEDVA